jgi:hypothetical protein
MALYVVRNIKRHSGQSPGFSRKLLRGFSRVTGTGGLKPFKSLWLPPSHLGRPGERREL